MNDLAAEDPGVPTSSRAPTPSWVALPAEGDFPTVLDFLEHRFPRIGRQVWRRRLEDGKVLDEDDRPVAPDAPFRPRSRLQYFREVEEEPPVPFREEVLYRDEHLLVVDKPPFLPVVPSGPYVNETLVYRLRRRTGEPDLTPVHRLDRATAGLVLCSRRRESRGAYARLFARRVVDKEYLAVAEVPAGRVGELRDRLATGETWHLASRLVRGTPPFRSREVPGEVNAVTHVELLALADGPGTSPGRGLFRIRPETGKKHQIRFHLASLGFPILGERYYPRLLPKVPPDFDHPLQLLAHRLAFRDPVSGEERRFTSRRRLGHCPVPWSSWEDGHREPEPEE